MMAHTIGKTLEVLLEVSFCTLAPSPDGHGVIFIGVTRWREFIEVWSNFILANYKEAYTVWTATVFLGVYLRLWEFNAYKTFKVSDIQNVLSAIEETRRLTGIGRLNTIREDIACCRMKLLNGWTH